LINYYTNEISKQLKINYKNKFPKIRKTMYSILGLSLFIQIFLGDIINFISALICFTTTYFTFFLLFRKHIFAEFILPVFIILSFNISILSGPLIFQSFFFNPITYNLNSPIITFSLSSIFLFSLIITLYIFKYFKLYKVSNKIKNSINKPLGMFNIPSIPQLWILGFIGFIALAWQSSVRFSTGVEYGNIFMKFLDGLTFFAYAPYIIILIKVVYLKEKINNKNIYLLIAYTLLMLIVSIAGNSRGIFAMAIANVLVLFFIFIINNQIEITNKLKRRLIIFSILGLILSSQFSDLATAIVAARADRTNVSAEQTIINTFNAFQDKDRLNKIKETSKFFAIVNGYNEAYIDNPFLSRFLNIKFFDNMFSLPSVIEGKYSNRIINITTDKLIALLPSPIINLMGLSINKKKLEFSMGDYLLNLEGVSFLGGFKVGSSVAHGFSMFSYWFFIIVIPVYLLFFTIIQSLTNTDNGNIFISPIIMLIIMQLYFVSHNDSFLKVLELILRFLPQTVIIYLIFFFITSKKNFK